MTEGPLRVRPARAADAPEIFAFCSRLWGGHRDYVLDVWDAWLAEGNLFAATPPGEDEQPVALLRVRLLSPAEAWFGGLRVHPDLHGRGAGRQLIAFAEDWARQRGAATMGYMTEIGNATMHRMADRLGYAPDGGAAWHQGPPGPAPDAAPEPLRDASRIDLARSPFLAAQGGLYLPDWAFQRLTPERLALHAAAGELFAAPDGAAWAVLADANEPDEWPMLAHAEGEPAALAALFDALRGTPAGRAHGLAGLLIDGSPLLAACRGLGFAATDERYDFFIKSLA